MAEMYFAGRLVSLAYAAGVLIGRVINRLECKKPAGHYYVPPRPLPAGKPIARGA